jgi:hypothetical protein
MSAKFDPYHKWLGIPPEEQPPHHYRLLGIRLFENDADVIDTAADRQMSHLRSYQSGPHSPLSQKLLNEVAAVRLCLLNAQRKAAYDQQLRSIETPRQATVAEVAREQPISGPTAQPVQRPMPIPSVPVSHPTPISKAKGIPVAPIADVEEIPVGELIPEETDPHLVDLFQQTHDDHTRSAPGRSGLRNKQRTAGRSGVGQRHAADHKKKPLVPLPMLALGGGGLLVILLLLVVILLRELPPEPGTLVFDWPADQRVRLILTIDKQVVMVPETGALSYRCSPGQHHIKAERPRYYPFFQEVTVVSGNEQTIRPMWEPKCTLIVQWPVDEQTGGTLTIDGEGQDLTSMFRSAELQFAIDQGQHKVRLTRPGYQPHEEILSIGLNQTKTIAPLWLGASSQGAQAIDLLALIDPEQHAVTPGWKRVGGSLISPAGRDELLQIPYVPPTEYILNATVERLSGGDAFVLILARGERQFSVTLDAWASSRSGLEAIDERRVDDNETTYVGALFPTGATVSVTCTVSHSGVRTVCNGQPVFNWAQGFEHLSLLSGWKVPVANALAILSWESSFRIRKLELIPLSGEGRAIALPTTTVVATSDHWIGNNRSPQKLFYSNGRIGAPLGLAKWAVQDGKLTMSWPSPEGSVDICSFSGDGRTYQGSNNNGWSVRGTFLAGTLAPDISSNQAPETTRLPVPPEAERQELAKQFAPFLDSLPRQSAQQNVAQSQAWFDAARTKDNPAEKFVFLEMACALAHYARSPILAGSIENEVVGTFDIPKEELLKSVNVVVEKLIDREVELRIQAALAWLSSHQLSDGGWSFDHSLAPACRAQCPNQGNMAGARNGATGLALLTFLATGHTHQTGEHRANVLNGLGFLSKRQQPNGSLHEDGSGNMYSHALATSALCQALLLSKDTKNLYKPAKGAVDFIALAQHPTEGGWRYRPREGGDTSVTGWQLSALKSGESAGVPVPAACYLGATKFLNYVQSADGAAYGYEKSEASFNAGASAIGLFCRMKLGWKNDHAAVQKGVELLRQSKPTNDNMYYNFYATQVLRAYGGPVWKQWKQDMRTVLLNSQVKDGHAAGSWFMPQQWSESGGRLYCTALAAQILEME